MSENIFSFMINQDIGRGRRIAHSAANYFRSIDKRSVTPTNVVNAAVNVAGTAGGVVGVATVAGTAAGSAIAASAIAAAVAGPQIAIAGAVIGLAMLAKGAYSNRESAHKKLSQYVWNLVDDEPPSLGKNFTKEGLQEASDAGLYLLNEGASQIKLLGPKLVAAHTKFKAMNDDLLKALSDLDRAETNARNLWAKGVRHWAEQTDKLAQSDKNKIIAWMRGKWTTETKPGGVIFEYVRRCAHVGNYIQAPHVVAMAMKETISPGSVVGQTQEDYFAGWPGVTKFRGTFTTLDKVYRNLIL